MGRQTYKEREKQRREEEILLTAERLLSERGYANLNMDDLAEVVGISKPTLYQHFKSKEELVAQVFLRGLRETEKFLAEPLTGRAMDRILALVRESVIRRYSTGKSLAGVRPDMIWNVLRANPDVEACKLQVNSHLTMLVEKAKIEGDITSEVPTPILLHSILSIQWVLHTPLIQAELEKNPAGFDDVLNGLLHLFLHGVTPRTESYRNNELNRN